MNNNVKIKLLRKSIFSSFEESVSIICKICESQIEEKFLLNIIEFVIKRPDEFGMEFIFEERDELVVINGVETVHPDVNYRLPYGFGRLSGIRVNDRMKNDVYIDIIPQCKISYNDFDDGSLKQINYRLDFGVFRYSQSDNELLKKYCIECDGYEFHGKKHQILKDNQRMKDLLFRKKFTTIRYLGTEIYHISEREIGKLLMNLRMDIPDY